MVGSGKRTAAWFLVACLGVVGLVSMAGPTTARAEAEAVTGYATKDRTLYSIGLRAGTVTEIGSLEARVGGAETNYGSYSSYGSVFALAFDPEGTLFGLTNRPQEEDPHSSLSLAIVDTTTGNAELVGPLGPDGPDAGAVDMTFDCRGDLWMVGYIESEGVHYPSPATGFPSRPVLFRVDPSNGRATRVVDLDTRVSSLTASGDAVFAADHHRHGRPYHTHLLTLDTTTGDHDDLGSMDFPTGQGSRFGGIGFAPDGTLWGIARADFDGEHKSITIDAETASTQQVTRVADPNSESSGFLSDLALPGGPFCPEAAAASDGGSGGGIGSILEGDIGTPATGPGTQSEPDGESGGTTSLPGRAEDSTVADRAPTVQGVGVAEPDDLASAETQGSSGGWAAALIATGLLGGLALVGVVGRRRLRGP